MAVLPTRLSFLRLISQHCIHHRPSTCYQSTLSNHRFLSSALLSSDSNSRRNFSHKHSKSESRQFGTFNRRQGLGLAGTVAGIVGFIAGGVGYLKNKSLGISELLSTFCTVSAATVEDDPTLPPSKRFNFIADVVDKAAPSVVYIELKDRHPFSGRLVTVSNGSGFIVRADGLIITNAHVVANKAAVKVRLYDGRELDGYVVAVDPVSDLAAVKVNSSGLPVLKMGLSCKLRAGEWVVAMGSPLSLSNTVTCGIVSSVNRGSKELGIRNKDMEYIQTDALINFGNSGGPLVNLDGEVIGINTMKVTPGISFAIPSDYASNFLTKVDDVLKRGQPKKRSWFNMGSDTARRRFIGITMLTLNSQLLMELKSRVPDFPDISGGVLVHKIVVGSPAFNGGLRAGDIITHINGQPAQSSADVYRLVETSETLAVVAYRGQHKMTFTIISEEVN